MMKQENNINNKTNFNEDTCKEYIKRGQLKHYNALRVDNIIVKRVFDLLSCFTNYSYAYVYNALRKNYWISFKSYLDFKTYYNNLCNKKDINKILESLFK